MDSPRTLTADKLKALMASDRYLTLAAERQELVRLAAPLYKERLCSLPFYKAREHDEQFWHAYIGSRVVAARELVARSLTRTAEAG